MNVTAEKCLDKQIQSKETSTLKPGYRTNKWLKVQAYDRCPNSRIEQFKQQRQKRQRQRR